MSRFWPGTSIVQRQQSVIHECAENEQHVRHCHDGEGQIESGGFWNGWCPDAELLQKSVGGEKNGADVLNIRLAGRKEIGQSRQHNEIEGRSRQ